MLKKLSRKIIFPTLFNFGADKLFLKFSKPSYLSILYHGVIPFNGNYFSPRHITAEQFEKQIVYFKKNFDIISQSELFFRVKNNIKPDRHTIALSFDDGFKNNLDYALPILEKHKVHCTFFISTILFEEMEIRCLWPDLIAILNYFYADEIIEIDEFKFVNRYDNKNDIYITDYLKAVSYDKRKEILSGLNTRYNLKEKVKEVPEELWKLMNLEEFRRLYKSEYVSIGAHSYLHYNLGQIEPEKARFELSYSKAMLESELNSNVNMHAFPDGNYNLQTIEIAEEVGYTEQYAVNYRFEEDKKDDRMLNRFSISSTTTFESNILRLNNQLLKSGNTRKN